MHQYNLVDFASKVAYKVLVSNGGALNVRKGLRARLLCTGLSVFWALNPALVIAGDAPLLAEEAAQHVCIPNALEPSSWLASDGADGTGGDFQTSPATSALRTEGPTVIDAEEARIAAGSDAKRDVSGTKWILFGFFVPVVAPFAAYSDREPPATRLIGKSPEYTVAYVDTWKQRSKAKRTKHAWIGVAIIGGLVLWAASLDCPPGGLCTY